MTLQGKDDNTSNYSFVIGKRTFWTYVVGVLSLMVAAFMMEDILLMAQSGLDTLGIEVTKIDINNENYYTRSSSSSVPYDNTATTGYRGVASASASATTDSASEVLTASTSSGAIASTSDANTASDASVASEWNYYPAVEKSTEATTTTTKAPRGGGRGGRGRGKKANQGDSNNNPQAAAAANTVVEVTAAPTTMAPTEAPRGRGRGRGRGKKANNSNNAISSTATTTVTMTANNNNVLLETDNNNNNIIQQVEEESTAAPQKTGRGGRAGRGNNQNKNNNLRADTATNMNNNDSDNVQVVEEEEEKIDPAVAARDLAARQEVWKALNDPALLKEQDSDPFYCRWAPDDVDDYKSTEHCKTKWTTPQICNNANDANNNPNRIGTRVLGFGDSTMSQQNFLIKHVIQRLDIPSIDNPNYKGRSEFCRITDSKTGFRCRWKQSTRCDNRDFFGFQNVTEYTHTVLWNRQPVWGVEGPMSIGRKTPGCSDCKHCETGYVNCEPVDDTDEEHPCQESKLPKTTQHVYQGGYINVEFARDVILQTNFFNTSQENIALFLKRQYNTPELVRAFGKPYCFVNTGHHDITIRETTLDIFLENVEWYLRLLHPLCQQIIWIGTNAPESDGGPFMQKIGNTYEWGEAVRKLLRKTQFGGGGKGQPKPQRIPYLDVYNASLTYAHRDNIHMNQSWYKSLANFVGDLMESCHEVTTRES